MRPSSRPFARTVLWAMLGLTLASCATGAPAPPLPPRPPERSSIDVLLRHRGELALTEEQVERLEALDGQLEREAEEGRARLKALRAAIEKEGKDVASGTVGPRSPGMGMGGHGSGRMGGAGRSGGRAARLPDEGGEAARLRQSLDDADTRAFLEAQQAVLTDAQRPAAESLASAFRAALYEYRAALVRRHGAADE